MSCETKWDHQFEGGICCDCGMSQSQISNKGFKKIELPKIKQKNITSAFQLLVDDVMSFFHEDVYKKGNFAKYARVIKLLGEGRTREFISYCKERKIHSPAYFWGMWKNFNSNLKWEK